jgi:hypothetical protein
LPKIFGADIIKQLESKPSAAEKKKNYAHCLGINP